MWLNLLSKPEKHVGWCACVFERERVREEGGSELSFRRGRLKGEGNLPVRRQALCFGNTRLQSKVRDAYVYIHAVTEDGFHAQALLYFPMTDS